MIVICRDSSNRPNDIPTSKWVVKGNEYNVIGVYKMNMQAGILGFELAEISLEGCAPYKYYAANRFIIKELKSEVKVEEKFAEELV